MGQASPAAERDGRLAAALRYREGLLASVRYARATPALFPETKLKEARVLSRDEREAVWSVWKTYLDYALALDSLAKASRGSLDELETFAVATLGSYRAALELIERVENDPGLDRLLNESVPELGLPAGTYAGFKLRYLNVARAGELGALTTALKARRVTDPAIEEDTALLVRMGKGSGEVMTVKNAFRVMKRAGFATWLPVQAGVAEWMGDTKVWRRHRSLVTGEQAAALVPRLRPGDLILERREWYLSNIGLPGFWPHAALYVGTPEVRRAFFDDAALRSWVFSEGRADSDYEALLTGREPKAYQASRAGPELRVIEAVSEGVVFSTVEHTAAADSVAVLRPRLPKLEIAKALLRAFHYFGRPYDFDFDFATDDQLVCSELVVKSYTSGLDFPTVEILGRKATPPNAIVRRFDETYGTPEQRFELVAFLDGDEHRGVAKEATVEAFRASWKRPKWDVFVKR